MSEMQDLIRSMDKFGVIQEAMKKDVHLMKEKMFDPDEGLFARVKDNTDFRKGATTWFRVMGISIVGILSRMFFAMFTNGR